MIKTEAAAAAVTGIDRDGVGKVPNKRVLLNAQRAQVGIDLRQCARRAAGCCRLRLAAQFDDKASDDVV